MVSEVACASLGSQVGRFVYPGYKPKLPAVRVHLTSSMFTNEESEPASSDDETTELVTTLSNASSPYCAAKKTKSETFTFSCAKKVAQEVLRHRLAQVPLSIGSVLDRPSFVQDSGGMQRRERVQKVLPKLRMIVSRLLRGMHRAAEQHLHE